MISSIVYRELFEDGDPINIVWTPCENITFKEFITKIYPQSNLIELNQTYYGLQDISLILCNNRLTHLDKCMDLAKFLCCPILVVDHEIKSDHIKDDMPKTFIINQIYSVALSQEISDSWGNIHNNILHYGLYDSNNKEIWKNLILQLCKTNITISQSI